MGRRISQITRGACRRELRPPVIVICALVQVVMAAAIAQSQPPTTPPIPAAPVPQFNGNKISMPTKRPVSRTSGLTLTVDPRWSYGYGYRPVEVTVTSPKATTADHSITIQLHTGWNRLVNVQQDLELPLGSTSATTIVALPMYQSQANNYFWWDVWVDGVRDKDLSVDRVASFAWGGSASGAMAGLTFLIAGPANNHRTLVTTAASEFAALSVDITKFPTRWIDYAAIDVVALSLAEAQQLAQQRPAAFEAIGRWVRAGGQLWITDVGGELENLPALSKLFQFSDKLESPDSDPSAIKPAETANAEKGVATDGAAKSDADDDKPIVENEQGAPTGWHSLRFRRGSSEGQVVTFLDVRMGTRRTVRDPEQISRMQSDPNFVTTEERFDPAATVPDRRMASDSRQWFVEQNLSLGAVRAFRGPNEVARFSQSPPTSNPNAVANSDAPDELSRALAIGLRRTERWDSRHGMTPDSANTEFAKFLVPGVGLAPVTEFEVLITLFVLLIGPVNYWVLKRFKRLHLMVLTVPLAAAITTAALFGYAILADGFATRVRAQSFTKLDQRTSEAACWTRLSYYSGLAPGKGLTLPADVAMYPILPGWIRDPNMGEERQLEWGTNEAKLKQGWLSSRTPTQYLSVRSRKSPHKIEVLAAKDKVRIKNQLGAKINWLMVVTDAGKIYSGEEIADSSSSQLEPINSTDAVRRIARIIVDNLPQAPPALATNDADLASVIGPSRSRRYGRYGVQYNNGRLSENLAGDALTNLAGLGGAPAAALSPRSYVAITETGPEVELGISYAQEEASFHVIQGKY